VGKAKKAHKLYQIHHEDTSKYNEISKGGTKTRKEKHCGGKRKERIKNCTRGIDRKIGGSAIQKSKWENRI